MMSLLNHVKTFDTEAVDLKYTSILFSIYYDKLLPTYQLAHFKHFILVVNRVNIFRNGIEFKRA